MTGISATEARSSLYRLIDEAAESHQPIVIMGKRISAVLVSEEDWPAIQETLYLLSVPGMREPIREGMDASVDECQPTGFPLPFQTGGFLSSAYLVTCIIMFAIMASVLPQLFTSILGGIWRAFSRSSVGEGGSLTYNRPIRFASGALQAPFTIQRYCLSETDGVMNAQGKLSMRPGAV